MLQLRQAAVHGQGLLQVSPSRPSHMCFAATSHLMPTTQRFVHSPVQRVADLTADADCREAEMQVRVALIARFYRDA